MSKVSSLRKLHREHNISSLIRYLHYFEFSPFLPSCTSNCRRWRPTFRPTINYVAANRSKCPIHSFRRQINGFALWFFSLYYPRLMATGTGDWLPKMLFKAAEKTRRTETIYPQLLSVRSRRLPPLASRSRSGARVIKSESINGTSQGIINNPASSGRRPFRNLPRRRCRRKEERNNIQWARETGFHGREARDAGLRTSGTLHCLHYALGSTILVSCRTYLYVFNYFVFASRIAGMQILINIRFAVDRFFSFSLL